jgi:hypothetical protein
MHDELSALLELIAVGAAWMMIHVRLLVRVARAPRSMGLRLLALVPPAAPIVGWVCGARLLPAAWGLFALLYLWLRRGA